MNSRGKKRRKEETLKIQFLAIICCRVIYKIYKLHFTNYNVGIRKFEFVANTQFFYIFYLFSVIYLYFYLFSVLILGLDP